MNGTALSPEMLFDVLISSVVTEEMSCKTNFKEIGIPFHVPISVTAISPLIGCGLVCKVPWLLSSKFLWFACACVLRNGLGGGCPQHFFCGISQKEMGASKVKPRSIVLQINLFKDVCFSLQEWNAGPVRRLWPRRGDWHQNYWRKRSKSREPDLILLVIFPFPLQVLCSTVFVQGAHFSNEVWEQQRSMFLISGPRMGSSPVRSIVQCLARKEGTDEFFCLKANQTQVQIRTFWKIAQTIQTRFLCLLNSTSTRVLSPWTDFNSWGGKSGIAGLPSRQNAAPHRVLIALSSSRTGWCRASPWPLSGKWKLVQMDAVHVALLVLFVLGRHISNSSCSHLNTNKTKLLRQDEALEERDTLNAHGKPELTGRLRKRLILVLDCLVILSPLLSASWFCFCRVIRPNCNTVLLVLCCDWTIFKWPKHPGFSWRILAPLWDSRLCFSILRCLCSILTSLTRKQQIS